MLDCGTTGAKASNQVGQGENPNFLAAENINNRCIFAMLLYCFDENQYCW
jgi:hypothetical protein